MFTCEHIHASVAQGCVELSRFGAGETGEGRFPKLLN